VLVARLACVFAPALACAAPDTNLDTDPIDNGTGTTSDTVTTGEPPPPEVFWLPLAFNRGRDRPYPA